MKIDFSLPKTILPFLKDKVDDYYLAGGTALAMFYYEHRESFDLDFFTTEKTFSATEVIGHMPDGWETDIVREGTIYGRLCGAQISFIAYPFFIPRVAPEHYGGIAILAPADIAVMKIVAISQRGRKRDFIDLFWYAMHSEPLQDVLLRLPDQYPIVAHDYHHILKSLVYFVDAEEDPMPKLLFTAEWKEVKRYFRREVPRVARHLLRLS